MSQPELVVDVAGARVGGAKRYLSELDAYLANGRRPDVAIIGHNRYLTPGWLIQRERFAVPYRAKFAINNASFAAGAHRVVALRNALHFATDAEFRSLGFRPSKSLRLQTPVIRRLASRAHQIEVPCTAMADRVISMMPELRSRIGVRHHPVSQREWATDGIDAESDLLVPVLNEPYKRMDLHLRGLLAAAEFVPSLNRIVVTGTPDEFARDLANDHRLEFVGRLPHETLDRYWARSRAIYYPTQIESFGYPLAEARANGRRVVALGTQQNREIAGPALTPFELGSVESLAEALEEAMSVTVSPDPAPFEPVRYFDEFLSLP